MSDIKEIVALVEGPTEQKFVREVLGPFFAMENIFKKTSTGIAIARETGMDSIRKACPMFNAWIETIEHLQ